MYMCYVIMAKEISTSNRYRICFQYNYMYIYVLNIVWHRFLAPFI